jgi:hypothetical protein
LPQGPDRRCSQHDVADQAGANEEDAQRVSRRSSPRRSA